MRTFRSTISLAALMVAVCFQAVSNAQAPAPRRVAVKYTAGMSALRVPIEINNNLILIETRLNGKRPLKLIFDTGASATVINADLQDELGISGTEKMDGTATGGSIEGLMARGVKIGVRGVDVSDQPVGILRLPRISGFDFDGALGFDFINQFVVEIDYLKKVMNLYDPGRYRYRGKGTLVPLVLQDQTPIMDVKFLFLGRPSVMGRLELDTGADNAFLLYAPFFEKHRLLETSKDHATTAGRGAGGETERILRNAMRVSVGPLVFRDVPVLFSLQKEGLDAGVDGIVGGEVLRRFKVIIDYSRRRMILEPNKNLKEPFEIEG